MEPLTVAATLESLSIIRQYVTAVAATAGLDQRLAYRLRLTVDEVATNIVTHGYAEVGLVGVLEIRAGVDEKTLVITIEDTGKAYDATLQPRADLDLPLEQREVGGLGLFLAMQSVDQFLYERSGDRNRHTLVMHRAAAS